MAFDLDRGHGVWPGSWSWRLTWRPRQRLPRRCDPSGRPRSPAGYGVMAISIGSWPTGLAGFRCQPPELPDCLLLSRTRARPSADRRSPDAPLVV